MPIIDGEKFACQSCIKGHRVSGCQHVDRELTHINPKGRPVKQCDHCRGARKAKSHHARCDCGSKKEAAKDKSKLDVHAEDPACGCNCYNGSQCSCGTKKEPLTLKLDTSLSRVASQQNGRPKNRLTTTSSDTQLTVFTNGHHKPCHRLNNSAHTSGAPYKIPRVHGHQSTPSAGHQSHGSLGRFPMMSAQGSVEDLSGGEMSNFGQFSSSVDSLPLNSLSESESCLDSAGLFYSQTLSNSGPGSDHSSPVDIQSADPFGFAQWPWSTASVTQSVGQYNSIEALSTSPVAGEYSTFDNDFAIPSAGLNPLWSAGDLPLNSSKLGKPSTPPVSLSGDSNRPSVPGLTTSSSSGAQSEVGDPVCVTESDVLNTQTTVADSFRFDEVLNFRRMERPAYQMPNTSTSWADFRQPPKSMPVSKYQRQQPIFHKPSSSVDLETQSFANVSLEMKANLYTTAAPAIAARQEFKASASYPNLGNAPRSLTLPPSPAEGYSDIAAWPSSTGLSNGAFDLGSDEFNFNSTVDLPNYQYIS